MSATIKKAWNVINWVLVAAVALLALLMGGVRLVGLSPYVVLSGSMEPAYQTGSLIYVKKVDPFTLQAGDVITFMMNEDTVATHRIVGVVPDEEDSTVIRFRTKGDANEFEDGTLVHYKNVIGMTALCILILLMFAPDLLRAADRADKRDTEKKAAKGAAGRDGPPET